jgi:hypothetical protein
MKIKKKSTEKRKEKPESTNLIHTLDHKTMITP